jgi:hypothetical protein
LTRPNSAAAKILRPKYQQILDRMNLMENRKTCTHIKISGVRCGSPSLRGAQFCYYHQRMHRGVHTPPDARLHPIACIEDKESIQLALMEVINGLLRNTLEFKRAALLLRALHIAVKNAGPSGFKAKPSSMVKEIPEYDEPVGSRAANGVPALELPFEAAFGQDPRASKPQRSYKTPEESARDRDEQIANYYGFPNAEAHAIAKKAGWTPLADNRKEATQARLVADAAARVAANAQAHVGADAPVRPTPSNPPVGTAALACPGGPAVSVRSALPPTSAAALPAHNLKAPNSTPRKPPMNASEVPATMRQATAGSGSKTLPRAQSKGSA